MRSSNSTLFPLAISLLLTALQVASCSSTSSTPASADADGNNPNTVNPNAEGIPAVGINDANGGSSNTTPQSDPVVPSTPESTPSTSDPMVQNVTEVEFEIAVPPYSSDELQVRVVWGNTDVTAAWVGDEFWSVNFRLPSGTENLLTVTFYDGNGEITLASYEQSFRTGTNGLEIYTITADQFDTDSWDYDNDDVSNIDELIAGTEVLDAPTILLFSETRAYRHDAIETALVAIEELAKTSGIQTRRADDSTTVFTDANIANYDAVVWVLTSGDVLDIDEQAVFERYIRSGGGYAGIHAASDTEYDWPWYGRLVGAYFKQHPAVQSATQDVEDRTHISTAHLGARWTRTDEWYDYSSNPRSNVNVLLTLDEDSYSDGNMGSDHPSAWYHAFDGGRSWYTGGGHTTDSYSDPEFRAHLLGGLRYAAKHNEIDSS